MSALTENQRVMREYQQGGRYQDVPISELQVLKDCAICFRGRERVLPEEKIMLLSPHGVVHEADGDRTLCGHDATGDGWWWRT